LDKGHGSARWSAADCLLPEKDVAIEDGHIHALSDEPWMGIRPCAALRPGGFVAIVYRLSQWDDPVRPVFRFWRGDGTFVERMAPGPVAGAGLWRGRIPLGTRRISVSPVARVGRFDFRIESIESLSFTALLRSGWGKAHRPARAALLTRLIGMIDESDLNLAWATEFHPFEDYAAWKAARERVIDLAGIDAPRTDWEKGPLVTLLLGGAQAQPNVHKAREARESTIDTVAAQLYPRWCLLVHAEADTSRADAEPRCRFLSDRDWMEMLAGDGPETGWLCALSPGDRLSPASLASLAERLPTLPQASLVYGDEEHIGPDGRILPILKPDWSPRLQAARPYLGRAVFVAAAAWRQWSLEERLGFVRNAVPPSRWLASLRAAEVLHIRRFLLASTRAGAPDLKDNRRERRKERAPTGRALPAEPSVCLIIPTRDRADLLDRCVTSIREQTAYKHYEILILDNDSVKAETTRLFDGLRSLANVSIVQTPGPFNYARICNLGAARTRADILVFLNNDTEALSSGWLAALVRQAVCPDVGTVGAKLLFASRRIQHIGVAVGMGNSACHFGAQEAEDAPGWLGRHRVLHEVSAVTGACLAVERRKFEAIGGFDEAHLAVELNDIDLCLRLGEHGWQSLVEPAAVLLHHESATRGGATFRPLSVNGEQRDYFQRRWRKVMRDDPYFHPALAHFRLVPALG